MKTFDVYQRSGVTPVLAKGCYLFDTAGKAYLDLYGGHGVISIGHSHACYIKALTIQLNKIGFYSNSVLMPRQEMLAEKLGRMSGYADYHLFLCNSGAEANENALKLASFHTGKSHVVAFRNSFHGRTSAALRITDDPELAAPVNRHQFQVTYLQLNDDRGLEKAFLKKDVCAVIVEGIQGVGGLDQPSEKFLKCCRELCTKYGAMLILDEIQSGFGRTGKFFAHQHAGIPADLITVAKGMGNGFPVAGVLIRPDIKARKGMLGTTFGGSYLACTATEAVLDILDAENMISHAAKMGTWLENELADVPGIVRVKGRGLMLGIELPVPVARLRTRLLDEHRILTGASANPNLIRILPPLIIKKQEAKEFLSALKHILT